MILNREILQEQLKVPQTNERSAFFMKHQVADALDRFRKLHRFLSRHLCQYLFKCAIKLLLSG